MKHIIRFVLVCMTALAITACGPKGPTWQEQYDLGVKYLSEGNYEEAVIAFTAAIEIDPKRAEAYVGRGDAYAGAGDDLAAAQADYLSALERDGMLAQVYGKLADLYLAQSDRESALAILQRGYDATGDADLLARLDELLAQMEPEETPGEFWRLTSRSIYNAAGELSDETVYTYREDGYCQRIVGNLYDWLNGMLIEHEEIPTEFEYDEAAEQVTLHYYRFGEETAQRAFDWTPGSQPKSQEAALFSESFGQFSYTDPFPGRHYCMAFADVCSVEDSFTKDYDGKTYTVTNERDENGNIIAVYTRDDTGNVSGHMTFQWEYYSAA